MMTVKLVEPTGHEQIYQVENVWADLNARTPAVEFYVPSYTVRATFGGSKTAQDGTCAKPADLTFGNYGTLYVMNEHGATVAKYFLGNGAGDVAATANIAA